MKGSQLERIRRHYGDEYILRQIAEECTELAQASLKMIRATRGETPMPVIEAYRAMLEEVADVRLMLCVLDKMLDAASRTIIYEQMLVKDKRMAERLLGE